VLTTYTQDFVAHPHAVLMPLIILAIPLYDMASVIAVRIASGRRIDAGDRSHFSHRLVDRGMSTRAAVGTNYLAVAATGLAAITLMRLPPHLAWIVLVQTICIVGMIALLEFMWRRRGSNER
jgi:UDP-GlcNAc:undecaprenyl-phosphate GlcNAc-1-phosphate transferase